MFRKSSGKVPKINSEFLRLRNCFRKVAKINSKFPIVPVFLTSRQAMHMVSRRMKQLQAQALSVMLLLLHLPKCRNLQNLSGFSALNDLREKAWEEKRKRKILQISEKFADFWKLSVISRNSDKIPRKSRRKITDFRRFQQHFAKISKKYRNFANFRKKSAFFEFKPVQRYVYLVDLEKCFKKCACSRYLRR